MRRLLPFSIFVLLVQFSSAQSLTGSWYGKADVVAPGINNNYLTELILKQKGNEIEGIFAYYFKDSYQSFFVRGTYNKQTRRVRIDNLPILFYRSDSRNGIECPMHFEGILMVSQVNSLLRGSFYSEDRYKYTCPELRVSFSLDNAANTDSALAHTMSGQKFWQPQEEDLVVTNLASNETVTINADAMAAGTQSIEAPARINEDGSSELIARLESRKTIYTMDVEVESDSLRISFYDNGDVDGDSISVFIDKKPVLVKQELTARALNIYVKLDSTKDVNEVTMFAENLGAYPPNTALMVITDGVKRHEVYLSSSLTQNAGIRLKRKKK
jgi:hypothetical protein